MLALPSLCAMLSCKQKYVKALQRNILGKVGLFFKHIFLWYRKLHLLWTLKNPRKERKPGWGWCFSHKYLLKALQSKLCVYTFQTIHTVPVILITRFRCFFTWKTVLSGNCTRWANTISPDFIQLCEQFCWFFQCCRLESATSWNFITTKMN